MISAASRPRPPSGRGALSPSLAESEFILEPVPCEHGPRASGSSSSRSTLEPRLGDALADQTLGRRHELYRLLQAAGVTNQALLLDGVLGVVPRIDLVGGEP